jgi:hypothetical protein
MPYTKAELVEQVYLRVTGGKPSPDVKIQRVDIPLYLNAAANYVITKEIRDRRRENLQSGSIFADERVSGEFLNTYIVDVQYDTQRGFRFIKLPARLQSLPNGNGLQSVGLLSSETSFVRMRDQYEDGFIQAVFSRTTRYWYEKIAEQEVLFFKNISPIVEQVVLRMVASLDSMRDDDLVGIPDNLIPELIDLALQFFLGQRQTPADMLNNNADDLTNNPR